MSYNASLSSGNSSLSFLFQEDRARFILLTQQFVACLIACFDSGVLCYLSYSDEVAGEKFRPLLLLSGTFLLGSVIYVFILAFFLRWVETTAGYFFAAHLALFADNACFAAIGYDIVAMLVDKFMCYANPLYYLQWMRSFRRLTMYMCTIVCGVMLNVPWIPYMEVCKTGLCVNQTYASSAAYKACKLMATLLQCILPMFGMTFLLLRIGKTSQYLRHATHQLHHNHVLSFRLHCAIACIFAATNGPYVLYDITVAFMPLQKLGSSRSVRIVAHLLYFIQRCGGIFNCFAACVACQEYRNAVKKVACRLLAIGRASAPRYY